MPNIEKKILRTVERTIDTHRMIHAGDTVLVGVSGGPDSVTLVHILLALAPKFSFQLVIAHLNHCLRQDESERDEAFVVSLADKLDLPLQKPPERCATVFMIALPPNSDMRKLRSDIIRMITPN